MSAAGVICNGLAVAAAHAPSPLQPPKRKPDFGVAVSVSVVPACTDPLQLEPVQLSAGSVAIVPPASEDTVTSNVWFSRAKVAVQLVEALTVTVTVGADPPQSPDQATKRQPLSGVALTETVAPLVMS
jgi:hypothetical protein